MGDYGGLGSRRMLPTITRTGRLQAECPMDSLGMIECAWTDPYSLVIPHSADATDWMQRLLPREAHRERRRQAAIHHVHGA